MSGQALVPGTGSLAQGQSPASAGDPVSPPAAAVVLSAQLQDGSEARPERLSVHVYGGKAALCFEPDETRSGVPTIAVDAAHAVGEREYSWKEKLRIQFTTLELPQVVAVLVGSVPRCEFKGHGPGKNKGFSLENQGGHFFAKVFAPGAVRAVPMPVEYAYPVAALFLRQLGLASPWLGSDAILSLVRATAPKPGVAAPPPR